MEQGHGQHGQVTVGILNLAVDFLESLDVGLHELGIEDAARPTLYDAQRETKPVRVSGVLAEELMKEIFGVHGIPAVVHADRGTSMTSKSVATLLADLGVTRSHSRPSVSNDCEYECVATGRV